MWLNEKVVRRRVLARQVLAKFGVGGGIALRHATVPQLSEAIIFARLMRPVNFGAADGRPADLVLLVLAPDKEPRTLLRRFPAQPGGFAIATL